MKYSISKSHKTGRQKLTFIYNNTECEIDVDAATSLHQKGQIIDFYLETALVLELRGPLKFLGIGELAPPNQRNRSNDTSVAEPPLVAEFILQLLAPKKTVEYLLGDLQEQFERNCARYGKSRAQRLYQAQVLRSIGPHFWRRIKRLGLIAFLIDYSRSKIGW